MKEGVKKSISLILVLTLLVQLLPMVAFGVGDETNDLDISTDSETVSMKDDDAEIVGEEDALREESVKHFRLRDGGYMLVEYETAVHYQTADGSWEEIDNTLQKTGQQYVAQAGDMTRKFAASLDSGFLFETAYQGQSVSMSLARRSSTRPSVTKNSVFWSSPFHSGRPKCRSAVGVMKSLCVMSHRPRPVPS